MASQLVVSNLTGAIVGPVSLSVAAGTCAAICGPSGAGKSLLLRMIADLVPSTGEVRLGDRARADMAAPLWRADVMYVGGTGWWASTVAAHIPDPRRADAAAWIARLGMEADYLDRAVATLSTGEAQRLALVRALVRTPKVLLLDEPTSALDATAVGRVEELLRDALRSGTIILLVTHEPAQAQRLADARYTMSAGRLSVA